MNKKNDLELEVCRYLDGELSADQEFSFEQRMVEDPELRELMEQYHRVDSLMEQLSANVLEIDEQIQRDGILAAVDLHIRHKQWRFQRLILRPVVGICAAAAIFVIAVCLYLIIASPQPKPPIKPSVGDVASKTIGKYVVAYHSSPAESSNVKVRINIVRPGGFGEGKYVAYSRTIRTKISLTTTSVVWADFSGGGVIAAFTTTVDFDEFILPGIFGYLTY